MPYEVACRCGSPARGFRRWRHQVVRCGACGHAVFVLPRSPLPPVPLPDGQPPVVRAAPSPGSQAPRRAVGVLVGGAVLAMGIVLGYLLLGGEPAEIGPGPPDLTMIRAHVAEGKKALDAGNFQLATEELGYAQAQSEAGDVLPPPEVRELGHLRRQAALLADLLTESLGEVLARAAGLQDREWEAVFARSYQGKAVVFDADVRRDAAGQYQLGYHILAGREPAEVAVGELKVLESLDVDAAGPVFFGGRLASIRREPPGKWVVRFDPDSGVLLTDAGGLTGDRVRPTDSASTGLKVP